MKVEDLTIVKQLRKAKTPEDVKKILETATKAEITVLFKHISQPGAYEEIHTKIAKKKQKHKGESAYV